MQTILVVVHLFLAIGIVTLVLMQHGKGADAGAAFGSGASATVFGSRGSTSFLSRTTGILAALFFITSMALAYYASQSGKPQALMDRVAPSADKVPAPPVGDAPAPVTNVPAVPAAVREEVPPVPLATIGGETGTKAEVDASGRDEARSTMSQAVPSIPPVTAETLVQSDVPPVPPPATIIEHGDMRTGAAAVPTEEERSMAPKND
jgi:preprotein translocase subunit SecG